MRALLRTAHKYLGLSLAVLWLLQALTGVLNVFHRELDDRLLGAVPTALDIDALGASVERLRAQRPVLTSIFAGGGTPGQFDIFVRDEAGATRVVRVDGAGTVLRERPWAHDFADTGLLHAARIFHETLFAGDTGLWFIGLSGLLLLSNLILGLKLAWPRAGQWRRTLVPSATGGSPAARFYAWHRAVGLWLAALAIVVVCAGVLTAWNESLLDWVGGRIAEPEVSGAGAATRISPAFALRTALAQHPGSQLAIVNLPAADSPWYKVRLRKAHDLRRIFGTTTVFVDARDGRILANHDAAAEPTATRFANLWYPLHTGEIAGLAGRLVALLVALWLLTMLTLGLGMWWTRRNARVVATARR